MMMKKWIFLVGAVALVACCAPALASVGDFLVDTNQFGYQGTVSNVTAPGTPVGPFTFPTPRDGVAYYTNNVPLPGYSGTYNAIQSDWYQHPLSNQNPGFFQINDGLLTVTSATGGWTQEGGGLWDFTVNVTGQNASYATDNSRLWQPDAGMAWGGTFTSYTYSLTATGMTTTVTDGWRVNTVDPTGITGSLDGTFVSTDILNAGDIYSVHLDFNKTYWDGTGWSDSYTDASGTYDYGNYSLFGALPLVGSGTVPEPVTMFSAFMALSSLGMYIRKRIKGKATV